MKFSIITPTYNRSHTLERSINSILNQEYQNFEMIIVDDGSTDETAKFMKKYENNSKIKYLQMQENKGVNAARNFGFKHMSKDSQWITLLDSDDEFFPSALSNMKKIIEKNKELNYFRFAEVFTNGKKACYAKYDGLIADYEATVSEKDIYGGWTATLNKSIIQKGFKFNETINGFESLNWFELSKTENCFYSLCVVKLYHIDTNSLTRPSKKDWSFYQNCKKGNELLFENFGEDMQKFKSKNLGPLFYELGKLNIIMGDNRKGIYYTLKAMKIEPFNLRIFRNILKIFLPSLKEPRKDIVI